MLTGGEFSAAIGKSGSCGGAEAPRRPARCRVRFRRGNEPFRLCSTKRGSVIKSGDIALVVSNKPDAFALQRAKNAGIEAVYLPQNRQDPALFETAARKLLKEREIDVVVLAGFLAILSADFTESYDRRIINVHPSLIPSFCGKGYYGLRVHEAALAYGVKVTGATVHYVNAVADGGEIIMQKAVDVLPGDTPETLQRRVMEQAEWELLPLALEQVFLSIKSTEQ